MRQRSIQYHYFDNFIIEENFISFKKKNNRRKFDFTTCRS